jgi:hypothetical protein
MHGWAAADYYSLMAAISLFSWPARDCGCLHVEAFSVRTGSCVARNRQTVGIQSSKFSMYSFALQHECYLQTHFDLWNRPTTTPAMSYFLGQHSSRILGFKVFSIKSRATSAPIAIRARRKRSRIRAAIVARVARLLIENTLNPNIRELCCLKKYRLPVSCDVTSGPDAEGFDVKTAAIASWPTKQAYSC